MVQSESRKSLLVPGRLSMTSLVTIVQKGADETLIQERQPGIIAAMHAVEIPVAGRSLEMAGDRSKERSCHTQSRMRMPLIDIGLLPASSTVVDGG